jgi:hypothetical protein
MNPPLAMMAQVSSRAICLRLGFVDPVTTWSVMPVSGEVGGLALPAYTGARRSYLEHA